MTLINTEGMVLIGPGSEWFWTAVSGIVLAITFIAIWRQLSLARSESAFTQLSLLVAEWEAERLVRKRLAVLIALRDGIAPSNLPRSAAGAVANYWEKVGSLARAGHVAPSVLAEGLGGADGWWGILAPWAQDARTIDSNPELFEHFEWLAATMVRMHPALAFNLESFQQTLGDRIEMHEDDLRDLEAMRMPSSRSRAAFARQTPER